MELIVEYNTISMWAKDRINEYFSIKNKDRSERIEMLREIYSGIIPKPEAGDQDHVSVHNYTLLY